MSNHDIKENKLNIILAFEFDLQIHVSVLECMKKGLDKFQCEECVFKIHTHSEEVSLCINLQPSRGNKSIGKSYNNNSEIVYLLVFKDHKCYEI